MTRQTLDNTFKGIESVNELVISGGEPLMDINLLKEVYESMRASGVRIERIYIVTNFVSNNTWESAEELTSVLRDLGGYITSTLTVAGSYDKYHSFAGGGEKRTKLKSVLDFHEVETITHTDRDSHGWVGMGSAYTNGISSEPVHLDFDTTEEIYVNVLGDVFCADNVCNASYEWQRLNSNLVVLNVNKHPWLTFDERNSIVRINIAEDYDNFKIPTHEDHKVLE